MLEADDRRLKRKIWKQNLFRFYHLRGSIDEYPFVSGKTSSRLTRKTRQFFLTYVAHPVDKSIRYLHGQISYQLTICVWDSGASGFSKGFHHAFNPHSFVARHTNIYWVLPLHRRSTLLMHIYSLHTAVESPGIHSGPVTRACFIMQIHAGAQATMHMPSTTLHTVHSIYLYINLLYLYECVSVNVNSEGMFTCACDHNRIRYSNTRRTTTSPPGERTLVGTASFHQWRTRTNGVPCRWHNVHRIIFPSGDRTCTTLTAETFVAKIELDLSLELASSSQRSQLFTPF